jgi:Site-specific recombinase XerD
MKSKINLQEYESHLRQEEKSQATIEKYLRDIRGLQVYLKMNEELNKGTIIAYKDYLIQKYAASSANSMLTAVNGYLEFIGIGECKVKLLKRQKKIFCEEKQELTKQEYERLLETAKLKKNDRMYYILQTIGATGIRIGELSHFTVQAVKEGKVEVYNKGKYRVVLIPKKLRKSLLKYAKRREIQSGKIFITRNQNPVNRSNVWAEMKRLCEDANVESEKVFPHNLRHLFARIYYKMRKDIMKLADLLGHSSVETTRLYVLTTGKEHERQLSNMGLCT